MIHHVSISAKNPQHVAEVLAEVMGGKCFPFPGRIVDSFMAVSNDSKGTMIEVYPEQVTLEPGSGDDQATWGTAKSTVGYAPFHLLLSVPLDEAAIQRIGDSEGWRTRKFGRAAPGQKPFFHVIEFWIENRLMVELATREMVAEYEAMFEPAKLDAMFAAREAAMAAAQ